MTAGQGWPLTIPACGRLMHPCGGTAGHKKMCAAVCLLTTRFVHFALWPTLPAIFIFLNMNPTQIGRTPTFRVAIFSQTNVGLSLTNEVLPRDRD